MCLWQRIVALSAGGFSTASEQQFSHIPIYFSHTLAYLVYPQPEISRVAHLSALLCPSRRDLAKIAKWIPGQRGGLCSCCYFFFFWIKWFQDWFFWWCVKGYFNVPLNKAQLAAVLVWPLRWLSAVELQCPSELVEWQEGEMWVGHSTLIPF